MCEWYSVSKWCKVWAVPCFCSDKEAQCEVIDQMMQEIIREEFEQEDATALAPCLCQILHSQFEPSILPQELDEELVTDIFY